MASHIAEVAIRKRVSAASDSYYEDAKVLGEAAWHAFEEKSRSQVAGLETIANSATRVADILDFIKRQTGRAKRDQKWRYGKFGENLLEKLDQRLRKDAQAIFENVQRDITSHQLHEDDQRRIHILLCREFIRHLSAHYLYSFGLSRIAL